MTLTLLHTAAVHCATFAALQDKIAPNARIVQHVRADWLARARSGGINDEMKAEIAQMVADADGQVMCTCTTLGDVATQVGAMRADQPMMQRAAEIGGQVLMVFCVESTRATSQALLEREIAIAGNDATVTPLFLGDLWPLFESGDTRRFCVEIANEVRGVLQESAQQNHHISSVILAQASMTEAAAHLDDMDVPVLTLPELALRTGLGI